MSEKRKIIELNDVYREGRKSGEGFLFWHKKPWENPYLALDEEKAKEWRRGWEDGMIIRRVPG